MTEPTEIGASKLAAGMPDIVKRIKAGESFTLVSNGVPIAEITPRSDRNDTTGTSEIERFFNTKAAWMRRLGLGLARDGLHTMQLVRDASDQRITDIRNFGGSALTAIRDITGNERQ